MPNILRRPFAILVLFSASCFAQELLRPTNDVDLGNNLTLGCNGGNQGSATMPLSRDAAGLSTQTTQTANATKTASFYKTRAFFPWQTTVNGYTALTLNINWSAQEVSPSGNPGNACILYSIDNGASYTSITCSGGGPLAQFTSSVNLAPTQPLTSLRVAVCVKAAEGLFTTGNIDSITVWDIWTVGTLSGGQGGGPGSTSGQAQRGAIIIN